VGQSVTCRVALKRVGLGGAGMALTCFGLASNGMGGSSTFTTIDYPNASNTEINGMAPSGVLLVVGDYLDSAGGEHGYLLKNGIFSSIGFPAAVGSEALGINTISVVVGNYSSVNASVHGMSEHGYALPADSFRSLD